MENKTYCKYCKYKTGHSLCLKSKYYEDNHLERKISYYSTFKMNKNNDCKKFELNWLGCLKLRLGFSEQELQIKEEPIKNRAEILDIK
jgi:hypothetical protein